MLLLDWCSPVQFCSSTRVCVCSIRSRVAATRFPSASSPLLESRTTAPFCLLGSTLPSSFSCFVRLPHNSSTLTITQYTPTSTRPREFDLHHQLSRSLLLLPSSSRFSLFGPLPRPCSTSPLFHFVRATTQLVNSSIVFRSSMFLLLLFGFLLLPLWFRCGKPIPCSSSIFSQSRFQPQRRLFLPLRFSSDQPSSPSLNPFLISSSSSLILSVRFSLSVFVLSNSSLSPSLCVFSWLTREDISTWQKYGLVPDLL